MGHNENPNKLIRLVFSCTFNFGFYLKISASTHGLSRQVFFFFFIHECISQRRWTICTKSHNSLAAGEELLHELKMRVNSIHAYPIWQCTANFRDDGFSSGIKLRICLICYLLLFDDVRMSRWIEEEKKLTCYLNAKLTILCDYYWCAVIYIWKGGKKR